MRQSRILIMHCCFYWLLKLPESKRRFVSGMTSASLTMFLLKELPFISVLIFYRIEKGSKNERNIFSFFASNQLGVFCWK